MRDLARRLEPAFALADGFVRSGLVVGGVLHVTHEGVDAQRAFGLARREPARPASTASLFPLFSATKPLVATAALAAADAGVLGLDDPVARWLPGFDAAGKGAITLRHLLAHSAGIPAAPGDDIHAFASSDAFVATLLAMAPSEPPGSRAVYHATTAFALLGAALARAEGMSCAAVLQARVLAPLGMRETQFPVSDRARDGIATAWADPADPEAVRWADAANGPRFRSAAHPAGGAYASAADVARLLAAWLHEGVSPETGRRILRAETVREALRIQHPALREGMPPFAPAPLRGLDLGPTTWGLGWRLRGDPPEPLFGFGAASPRAFGHAGLGSVLCWADPVRALAFVWLTNTLLPLGDALRTRVQLTRAVIEACE